jgi:hypothetical protein
MKRIFVFILQLYLFLSVSGSVFAIGEHTISLGGEATWKIAGNLTNIMEVRDLRPNSVLILSCAGNLPQVYNGAPSPDLSISFDQSDFRLFHDASGRYDISITTAVEAVDRRFARAGFGAALFNTNHVIASGLPPGKPLIIQPRSRSALFAPGNTFRDFSIEFWMYPLNLENGEQILSWTATRPENGKSVFQRIQCIASRNRLNWSFINFFTLTDGVTHIKIEFSGDSYVVPKTWSHHLVRFDSVSGMIEYLVDGKSETIIYATSTGRGSGEIFTPIAGTQGEFVIGERYTGMIDEFKIFSAFAPDNEERLLIQKYALAGGRVETSPVDLGSSASAVLKVDATGGRASINRTRIINEFRDNGRFRFTDDSELNFFIRANDNPWHLNEMEWVPFTPGTEIKQAVRGRFAQIAVDFYPSSDGETSPYLDEVRIVYMPNNPPMPPKNVTAVAVDGAVYLSWVQSPDANTSGYLVYYSSVRGELFGQGAALGASPIDVGKRSNILIEGLKNGALYYFSVVSYDTTSGVFTSGEFSREVTARPLAGLQFELP